MARTLLTLLLASPLLLAEMVEDFESPWPASGWVTATGSAGTVTPDAGHDSFLGYEGTGGWEHNLGATYGFPNQRLSMWTRADVTGGAGSTYLGFGADAGGCYSLRFSTATNDLRFQDNSGWSFVQLNAVPISVAPGQWVRVEVEFVNSSYVVGRLFDSDGFTLLANLSQSLARSPQGGIAIRAAGTAMQIDSITQTEPRVAPDDCARVAEDFEHIPWPAPGWIDLGLGSTTGLSHPGAGHDGWGFIPDDLWQLNPLVQSGVPGTRLTAWVRTNSPGGAPTRIRLGWAASTSGCYSFVFAPDVGQIRIEDNTAWASTPLHGEPAATLPDHWYLMEIWIRHQSAVRCTLYDSDGVTVVATLGLGRGQSFGTGGIAFRGGVQGTMFLDTIEVHGPAVRQGFNTPLWTLGTEWTSVGGGVSGTIASVAGHSGGGGYLAPVSGSTWELNTALAFGRMDDRVSMWTRGDGGTAWLGVLADPSGCTSLCFAASEGRVRFEDNSGWGSSTLSEVEFHPEPDTWYRLEVERAPNHLLGRVLAPDGAAPLVCLEQTIASAATGGIAFRGLGGQHLDDLEDWTPGAACACPGLCGDCDRNGTTPDILDALVMAQIAVGLVVPLFSQTTCCDFNGSGTIEILDALQVAQAAVGIPVFPQCP